MPAATVGDAGETETETGPVMNLTRLLLTPPTVTTTFPVVAPDGTGTEMLVELQLVGAAGVLLKVTVLDPCADPKFVPLIVTAVPAGPNVGLKLVMLGVVPADPPADLKAASAAPQLSDAPSDAPAETDPESV